MTRRGILRWTLGTVPIVLVVPATLAAAASRSAIARNLRELLGDPESARAIGRVHLAARSTEADCGVLIGQVAADGLMIDAPLNHVGLARRRLRATIRQDFAEGRIAVVDGWRLSLTEVRLCTLAALLL